MTSLVGATGLVGSHILQTLLHHSQVSTVATVSRRPLSEVQDPESRLIATVDSDSQTWASHIDSLSPGPQIFFSGIGTTKGAAGSFEAQRKVDYDLNLALARAAKQAGAKTYVLISATGANSKSIIPYSKMKGELEAAVVHIGFEHVVLVQPGFLIGKRPAPKFGESGAQRMANLLGKMSGGRLKDIWAQDAEIVARAAVSAGLLASNGKSPQGNVWTISQSDIVRLGRTEWSV